MAIVERFTAAEARFRSPPIANSNDHDLLFLISNLARAGRQPARTAPASSAIAPRLSRNLQRRLWPADPPSSSYLIPLRSHPQHNSKRITSECQTGSLQVAVSKTLRRPDFRAVPEAHPAGAFPIQP